MDGFRFAEESLSKVDFFLIKNAVNEVKTVQVVIICQCLFFIRDVL